MGCVRARGVRDSGCTMGASGGEGAGGGVSAVADGGRARGGEGCGGVGGLWWWGLCWGRW